MHDLDTPETPSTEEQIKLLKGQVKQILIDAGYENLVTESN